jgi:hypothetical protein
LIAGLAIAAGDVVVLAADKLEKGIVVAGVVVATASIVGDTGFDRRPCSDLSEYDDVAVA